MKRLHCWRRNINRLDKIKNEENPMDYFEDLFMFMENNPNIDYGMPGPIVHFMESYYKKGYEDELLKSVKRKPTQRTVWMLNRVLNDVNLIGREKYIGVMEEAIKRTDVDLETKKEIKGFLVLDYSSIYTTGLTN